MTLTAPLIAIVSRLRCTSTDVVAEGLIVEIPQTHPNPDYGSRQLRLLTSFCRETPDFGEIDDDGLR